jgi:hypothetical protein
VFSGTVDISIKNIWDRINLAMIMNCLPSDIDNESNRDIQAIKIILTAKEELKQREM